MQAAEKLAGDYEFTTMLALRFLDGVTHAESVVTPSFGGNCLNWVTGHVIAGRRTALELLGEPTEWLEPARRYARDSQPVRGAGDGEDVALLRDLYRQSSDRVAEALRRASDAVLGKEIETELGRKPALEHVAGQHWHETYHLGQLELLRTFIEAGRHS